jgi:tetratricopeptide (TPR) repeat protein
MRANNLLGAIEFELGRLDRAEHRFGEALRLAQQLNDSLFAARASNNLAAVAQLRGNPDRALGLYRRALLDYQRLGDRRGLALTYHNLGLSFRQLSRWREADAAAVQAVRLAELESEGSLLALTLTGRAELDIEREELDLAAQGIARAIRAAEEADDEIGAAEARRLRACVALRRRHYRTARDDAETSRAVAVRHGSALLEAESAAALALALRGLGLTEAAAALRADAIRGFQALGATAWVARFDAEWSA